MTLSDGFLKKVKATQPDLWALIEKTAKDGLFVVDEENDAITATNRLLWTYPDLHLALSTLINSWSEKEIKNSGDEKFKELINNLPKEEKDDN